jgi:hypothetical protein
MNKKQAATLFGLFFDPEDGGSMFLWNISELLHGVVSQTIVYFS